MDADPLKILRAQARGPICGSEGVARLPAGRRTKSLREHHRA